MSITRGEAAESGVRGRRLADLPAGVLGVIGILIALLVGEIVPRLGIVDQQFLPPVSQILGSFVTNLTLTAFWVAVGQTMLSWAIGLAIASVAAITAGLVIGTNGFLREATHSTIEFLRPIPSVALIPLAVLLFGVRIQSSLMLIIYAAFWQILIQVLAGVADVDTVAENTARSYGLGPMARMRHVTWPTALPYVMTGLRLGAAVALILAVTAELIIGNPGLGHEIALAQAGGAATPMYALVLFTGLLGVLINVGMRWVERKALAWHPSVRGEVFV